MGAWGTSLYANDTTLDVHDVYMDFLREQLSNEEAFAKTITEFKELMGDEDEEPLFWFALAETQWKIGRLTPEVKSKALEWIDKDGGMMIWEENGVNSGGWKKTLVKLKATLESPMRSEKKIKKPVIINQNLWETGDVYAYQFHKERSKADGTFGKYIVMQKIGASPWIHHKVHWITQRELQNEALSEPTKPMLMLVHTYDKIYDYLPTLKELDMARLLPIDEPYDFGGWAKMSRFLKLNKKKDYPENHLFYLGKAPISADNRILLCNAPIFWDYLEDRINLSLSKWKGVKYTETEEGVYEYPKNNLR
jgi:hypothetical protein